MMEWLERLRAELDKDERAARAAEEANPTPWRPGSDVSPYDDQDVVDANGERLALCPDCPAGGILSPKVVTHVSRQGPNRTLDIVLAHRKILADYVTVTAIKDAAWAKMREGAPLSESEARECGQAESAEVTLRSVLEYIVQGYGVDPDE